LFQSIGDIDYPSNNKHDEANKNHSYCNILNVSVYCDISHFLKSYRFKIEHIHRANSHSFFMRIKERHSTVQLSCKLDALSKFFNACFN